MVEDLFDALHVSSVPNHEPGGGVSLGQHPLAGFPEQPFKTTFIIVPSLS